MPRVGVVPLAYWRVSAYRLATPGTLIYHIPVLL